MIEFAILMPLLITLLLGVVEFAWLFSQNIDVRHGAREGARLAATDYGNETTIANETCDRMDIAGTAAVTVNLTRSGATIGDEINVTVTATPASLTGFFDYILPATLTSSIETRLEQSPSWSSTASPVACP